MKDSAKEADIGSERRFSFSSSGLPLSNRTFSLNFVTSEFYRRRTDGSLIFRGNFVARSRVLRGG